MTNATAQAQQDADEERYFRRLWPRPPRSRRLVTLTILAGTALTLFGIVAFWQINHVFSLIDEQRRHQANGDQTLKLLSEIDILLRRNNSISIDAVRTLVADRAADISGILDARDRNQQALKTALAQLDKTLTATGKPDYQQFYQSVLAMVEEMVTSRERLVREFQMDHDLDKYIALRDRLQSRRTTVADSMLRLRGRMEPDLDAAQRAIDRELNRAFIVSCLTLGTSGVFIFMLGWMLVRYVGKRDDVEAHLRRATDMWIGIINALKQGVAVFGYDQRLMLWNPRYAELQGVDAAKLYVGMSAAELRSLSVLRERHDKTSDNVRFKTNMERVRRGETFDREVLRVDGTRIQLGFHPMADEYFVITVSDMTQVRQAEQLARDQAVRLGVIMDNVPDAIVVINASGSIESWNAGAERMFGYKESAIIHRNVSVLMPEPHASRHDSYLRRYMETEDNSTLSRLREFIARRQDGTEFPIDLRISEMQLGDKRMFTGVIRDITERRAVEQMKSEFISTVSHELRTPLTSIVGSLTLLVDGVGGALPDKARRLIVMAEKNSQRLGRLINDILDLEKAEAGRMTLRLEPVKLLPVLQHSLELNQSYAARFDVSLRLQPGVDSIVVPADEVRLLQVMSNLLSNAIKQSPPGSQVLVEVERLDRMVRVTVHDAGAGIAEEFKERVFQRFAQADGSSSRRVAGTGLGLAITKQLVEQHGGCIGFDTGESKVGDGRGASFWFELPVVAAPTVPDVGEPLNMNVVLCEDDPDVAELLMQSLQLEGCSVRHTDIARGVPALLDAQTSVLLMDVDLPDGNGLGLVADLRRSERWPDIPVVVVSGKNPTNQERTAHDELRICAWLSKPTDRATLRAALIKAKNLGR